MTKQQRRSGAGRFARLIREARRKKGWTGQDLLTHLRNAGVTSFQSAISAWENGVNLPRSTRLASIAEVLDLSLDDVVSAHQEDALVMGKRISSYARAGDLIVGRDDLEALMEAVDIFGPLSVETLIQLVYRRRKYQADLISGGTSVSDEQGSGESRAR